MVSDKNHCKDQTTCITLTVKQLILSPLKYISI
ncbi:hypothetical protein [Campylobacter phage CJLB-4]|nr:hypothetical protein [Campylobacter phage CJLB-4]